MDFFGQPSLDLAKLSFLDLVLHILFAIEFQLRRCRHCPTEIGWKVSSIDDEVPNNNIYH
jgi:hypothetical protein